MDVLFLVNVFRFYVGMNVSFPQNTRRKNLFLSVCQCLDDRVSMREMDQLFPYGRVIGYGNSKLDIIFRHSKVFRLHAILHDAAGAFALIPVEDQDTAT